MAKRPRLICDELVYYAINRGNNRAGVFTDEDDHRAFLEAIEKTRRKYPFRLLGYCLMTNHFHLLLRPESGQSISRILQSLTVTHTWRHHKRHRTAGHVEELGSVHFIGKNWGQFILFDGYEVVANTSMKSWSASETSR